MLNHRLWLQMNWFVHKQLKYWLVLGPAQPDSTQVKLELELELSLFSKRAELKLVVTSLIYERLARL